MEWYILSATTDKVPNLTLFFDHLDLMFGGMNDKECNWQLYDGDGHSGNFILNLLTNSTGIIDNYLNLYFDVSKPVPKPHGIENKKPIAGYGSEPVNTDED